MINKISTILNSNSKFFELIRFVIVGSLATLVDLSVSSLLFFLFELNPNVITTSAFIVAFCVSFLGHKNFTFKKSGSIIRFFSLALAMLLLRNVIVYFLVMYMHALVAIILAMVIVTFITFFVSKFFIFVKS